MIDNISEWKSHENSLKQTAVTDPLTGVYNRGFGLKTLEEAIFDAKNGTPFCAAFIDLDGLKVINDVYGHNSGDYAIRTVCDALSTSVRDRDIVCRFGGDEFIIIFKNCTEPVAQQAIKRMIKKLDDINMSGQNGFDLEFSHGIIEIDGSCDDMQDLIEEMDQIMYKNKAARKQAKKLKQDLDISQREAVSS